MELKEQLLQLIGNGKFFATPQETARAVMKNIITPLQIKLVEETLRVEEHKFEIDNLKYETRSLHNSLALTGDDLRQQHSQDIIMWAGRCEELRRETVELKKENSKITAMDFECLSLYAEIRDLKHELETVREQLKQNLPEDCVCGYSEVKFCSWRNTEGNKCKQCAD